jgi:hypothetical protein
MFSAGLELVLFSHWLGLFFVFVLSCRLFLPHTFWKAQLLVDLLSFPFILLIVNMYRHYSPCLLAPLTVVFPSA